MNTALSVGGLGVGLAVLVWYLLRWWNSQKNIKTGKDWRSLTPLASGITLGILAASCAGGLLGTVAGWVRSLSNMAGDKAISGATGTATQTIGTAGVPALTPAARSSFSPRSCPSSPSGRRSRTPAASPSPSAASPGPPSA